MNVIYLVGLWFVVFTAIPGISGLCTDKSNTTCGECVKDFDCYWCANKKTCDDRPTIKPSSKDCDGKWYSYMQCSVSGNLLLIIVPVIAGVLLIIIIACIYCCCCRQCLKERRQKKWAKQDSRTDQRKMEREEKHNARQEERRLKHDQIRMKYGLFKEEPKYEKFDAS